MKISDCHDAYKELSGKASELSRTLSLSGIAIIWVFKVDTANGPEIPEALFGPALFVVAALALDLIQYISGAIAWGGYGRYRELGGTSADTEFLAPPWLNWPMLVAFYSKLACVSAAYFYLLRYLLERFV